MHVSLADEEPQRSRPKTVIVSALLLILGVVSVISLLRGSNLLPVYRIFGPKIRGEAPIQPTQLDAGGAIHAIYAKDDKGAKHVTQAKVATQASNATMPPATPATPPPTPATPPPTPPPCPVGIMVPDPESTHYIPGNRYGGFYNDDDDFGYYGRSYSYYGGSYRGSSGGYYYTTYNAGVGYRDDQVCARRCYPCGYTINEDYSTGNNMVDCDCNSAGQWTVSMMSLCLVVAVLGRLQAYA